MLILILGFGSTSTVVAQRLFCRSEDLYRPMYYKHERQIFERLKSSPSRHIVCLLVTGKRHLDLEYVSGDSLWDVISNNQRFKDFTEKVVSGMLVESMVGLEHFHRVT